MPTEHLHPWASGYRGGVGWSSEASDGCEGEVGRQLDSVARRPLAGAVGQGGLQGGGLRGLGYAGLLSGGRQGLSDGRRNRVLVDWGGFTDVGSGGGRVHLLTLCF